MDITTSGAQPKLALSTLELKTGYFVVPANGVYNYFPVKVQEDTLEKPIMRFEKAPPVLIDGILMLKRKMYEVSAEDILRGIIHKSREIKTERVSHGSRTTSTNPNPATTIDPVSAAAETIRHQGQQGSVPNSVLEITEDVDSAWQEQVGTLLDLVSSKEGGEWEVTSSA